jgi:hypothetical protein
MADALYDSVDAISSYLTIWNISYIHHIYTAAPQYESVDATWRYLSIWKISYIHHM